MVTGNVQDLFNWVKKRMLDRSCTVKKDLEPKGTKVQGVQVLGNP
jgi:hypothetical protein